jgi:hypothetical protein
MAIPKMLDSRQAAEALGLTVNCLEKWRVYRKGPTFLKIGGAIRYRETDLERFIEASAHGGPKKAR